MDLALCLTLPTLTLLTFGGAIYLVCAALERPRSLSEVETHVYERIDNDTSR